MNFDIPTPSTEKEPRFPSLEEIANKILSFCKFENPVVVRTIEDERGIALHEIVVTDEGGDDILYVYRRAGDKAATTDITANYFIGKLEDGICPSGENFSTYDEKSGKWIDAQ